MRNMILKTLLLLLFQWGLTALGQIPAGYYNTATGLSGYTLKTALYNIIKNHTVISYNNLYSKYPKTDAKPGNVVWDMYSDVPGGTPAYTYHHTSGDQCGSYNSEGDCYNREHSFPSSWFNDASPMYSDLFNVIPTDGYVNNRRSNYPLAEVGSAYWSSSNGSKLGYCGFPGWTEVVFEPIDEYKGDFARIMFYMATRYENLIAGWKTNPGASCVLTGNSTAVFWQWYINQLIDWHESDTVSLKEIARNDSVYKIQDNRNPYVDHPEWIGEIWTSTLHVEQSEASVVADIYPNPCVSYLNVMLNNSEPSEYLLETLTGKRLRKGDFITEVRIDMSDLPSGAYLLELVCHDQVLRKLIIKN